MSLVRPSNRVLWIRRAWCLVCVAVLWPLAGCTGFQSACSTKWMEDAFVTDTDSLIDHVAVRWDNHLRIAPDPMDYTAGINGLIGRVYLISEQSGKMCEAHGWIVIGMFDMTPTASGRPPVAIANYKFDAENLKRLKVKDPISDVAYTVFLPWKNYRPEIKQVKLLVKYVTRRGDQQQVADPTLLTLQSSDQAAATFSAKTGPTLERQFDMRPTLPTMPGKMLQGPPQPMPYAPMQMDKILPPTGPALPQTNRPNVPQQSDAPLPPIVMPSQRQTPQASQPPDEWQNPSAKTTVQYFPPPTR